MNLCAFHRGQLGLPPAGVNAEFWCWQAKDSAGGSTYGAVYCGAWNAADGKWEATPMYMGNFPVIPSGVYAGWWHGADYWYVAGDVTSYDWAFGRGYQQYRDEWRDRYIQRHGGARSQLLGPPGVGMMPPQGPHHPPPLPADDSDVAAGGGGGGGFSRWITNPTAAQGYGSEGPAHAPAGGEPPAPPVRIDSSTRPTLHVGMQCYQSEWGDVWCGFGYVDAAGNWLNPGTAYDFYEHMGYYPLFALYHSNCVDRDANDTAIGFSPYCEIAMPGMEKYYDAWYEKWLKGKGTWGPKSKPKKKALIPARAYQGRSANVTPTRTVVATPPPQVRSGTVGPTRTARATGLYGAAEVGGVGIGGVEWLPATSRLLALKKG